MLKDWLFSPLIEAVASRFLGFVLHFSTYPNNGLRFGNPSI